MKFKFILATALSLGLVLSACGSDKTTSDTSNTETQETENVSDEAEGTDDSAGQNASSETDYKNAIKNNGLPQLEEPAEGEDIYILHTTKGDISLRFFPEFAPLAVENFKTLASQGYYDGIIFHRVINNFMIQGGDPTGTGTGGESIYGEDFGLETTPCLRHFRGALAMANTGQPNSNGSQFYIVQNPDIGDDEKKSYKDALSRQDEPVADGEDITIGDIYPAEVINEYTENGGTPFLDGNYTVFGQVVDGMDVVDAIAASETDENDKPLEDIVINSISVEKYSK